MTHKPNPKHLPPVKSANEYEREITALQAKVAEMHGVLAECLEWMSVAQWQGQPSIEIGATFGKVRRLLLPTEGDNNE